VALAAGRVALEAVSLDPVVAASRGESFDPAASGRAEAGTMTSAHAAASAAIPKNAASPAECRAR